MLQVVFTSPASTLGGALSRRMRRTQDVAYLEGIDFVWDVKVWQWERTFEALRQYCAVHGNCDVPRKFKVPSEAPWPTELWGMNLGYAVSDTRHKEYYIKDNPERIELLRTLGFRFKTLA